MEKASIQKGLLEMLGKDKLLSEELDLLYYSYDSSFLTKLQTTSPYAVVFPKSTDDVQKIMNFAYLNDVNVIPRGAGTGETGGCVAVEGGIVLDLSTWDEIIEIDEKNMQVVVRPGVIHAKLNEELAKFNLFFPRSRQQSDVHCWRNGC